MFDMYQIIMEPIITEKSSGLLARSTYVFKVLKKATKDQIKQAVQKCFGVEVEDINTSCIRGKTRKLGRSIGRTTGWKKAYVKLKQGQKIKELEAGA